MCAPSTSTAANHRSGRVDVRHVWTALRLSDEDVNMHVMEIGACYEQALEHDPNLEGTMILALTIGPLGNVWKAAIDNACTNTKPPLVVLSNDALGTCITSRAKAWRLKSSPGSSIGAWSKWTGGDVRVCTELVFSSAVR